MTRSALYMAVAAVAFAVGFAMAPVSADEPLIDDQSYHPQMLPRTSMEYELLVKRKGVAQAPKPGANAEQIGEAMTSCEQIQPLSTATREKCEIRARQSATGRAPVAPIR